MSVVRFGEHVCEHREELVFAHVFADLGAKAIVAIVPIYAAGLEAAVLGVLGKASGLYELGGPEVHSMRELLQEMLKTVQRRRLILNLPFFAAWLVAFGLDLLQSITFGLFSNSVVTRDQLRMLRHDNVVSDSAKGFAHLGIQPTPIEGILETYLWRFRPSGQYDAIKNSAKNLG